MRKQEYFDMWINAWLAPAQIEGVLCRILDIPRETLFTLGDISSRYIYEVQQAFYKFQSGVPEAYTTQKVNFYSRDFYVDERVLIPRTETELLVSEALRIMNEDKDIKNTVYIDVWTGSTCIATSIILEMYPLVFSKSYGLEISEDALIVAQKNIETHQVDISLMRSDLLEWVYHDEGLRWKNLCVTANLPYIKDADHANMWADVIAYEPDSALYGGPKTGFELYEQLIKQCFQIKEIHKIGSINLFIEIGFDQEEVSGVFLGELWLLFEYFRDSAKISRVIHIWGF